MGTRYLLGLVTLSTCLGGLLLGGVGCQGSGDSEFGAATQRSSDTELIRAIQGYERAENQVLELPRWALALCAPPVNAQGVQLPHMSRSKDSRSHGERIATFYASPVASYVGLQHGEGTTGRSLPEGMFVVKQTWHAETVSPASVPSDQSAKASEFVVEGDHAWKKGQPRELFVLYKPPAGSPLAGTADAGWTYAVLTSDAKRVLE